MTKKLLIITLLSITSLAYASESDSDSLSSASNSLSSSSSSSSLAGSIASAPVSGSGAPVIPSLSPAIHALAAGTLVPADGAHGGLPPALATLANAAANSAIALVDAANAAEARSVPTTPPPLANSDSNGHIPPLLAAPHGSLSASALLPGAVTTTAGTYDPLLVQFAQLAGMTDEQMSKYYVITTTQGQEVTVTIERLAPMATANCHVSPLSEYIAAVRRLDERKETYMHNLCSVFCNEFVTPDNTTAALEQAAKFDTNDILKKTADNRVLALAKPVEESLKKYTRIADAFYNKSKGGLYAILGGISTFVGLRLMRSSINPEIVRSAAAAMQFVTKNGIGVGLTAAGMVGVARGLDLRYVANQQLKEHNPQGLITGYKAALNARQQFRDANATLLNSSAIVKIQQLNHAAIMVLQQRNDAATARAQLS